MDNINQTRICEILEKENKWWKGDIKLEFKPREIYEEIKKFLKTRQIIALTGLRRVGKTTLMLKIAEDSLQKFGRRNVIYFSFDEFRRTRIDEVMDIYSSLLAKDLERENYLFLFDEVQKIKDWEEQIKRIYDLYPKIKLVLSGSESLFIKKKSRESLTGRMFEFQIKPLNFREYLLFKNKEFDNFLLYQKELLKEFHSFLLDNGFPEIINEEEEVIEKYVKENIIEKIIYRDIPEIFPMREPSALEQLFKIILSDPGEIVNLDDLSRELGLSRQTVSLYLDYLEKSFLIKKLYNFSRSARKTQRKFKKYYPTILLPETVKKNELFGKVFETVMVLQLEADFFWRDAYKNEVDVIKLTDEEILPIEIKSAKIELKPLKLFLKKFKISKGLVLTYDKKEEIDEIEVVPFYEFFLKKLPLP
ncbi:MAG: ATP-binding protein [Nanoarchaeota archaeon]